MTKYYAGIGARSTPLEIQAWMSQVATWLETLGYILRSGGAPGADKAFEAGVTNPGNKEIYLPWAGFEGYTLMPWTHMHYSTIHEQWAEAAYPHWKKADYKTKQFMTRNSAQLLGTADTSWVQSSFVVCWTPRGGVIGGTGQAIRMARMLEIPVYNMADPESIQRLQQEQVGG